MDALNGHSSTNWHLRWLWRWHSQRFLQRLTKASMFPSGLRSVVTCPVLLRFSPIDPAILVVCSCLQVDIITVCISKWNFQLAIHAWQDPQLTCFDIVTKKTHHRRYRERYNDRKFSGLKFDQSTSDRVGISIELFLVNSRRIHKQRLRERGISWASWC